MSYSIEQYINEVSKTKKTHATKTEAVFDWYLGLIGEAYELAEVINGSHEEIIKEAGDCLWYLAAMHDELDLPMRDFPDVITLTKSRLDIIVEKAEVFKHHFFGKDPGGLEIIAESLDQYYSALTDPLISMGFRVEGIAELNAAKLKHRHGDKFSHESSVNRKELELKFVDTEQYQELLAGCIL